MFTHLFTSCQKSPEVKGSGWQKKRDLRPCIYHLPSRGDQTWKVLSVHDIRVQSLLCYLPVREKKSGGVDGPIFFCVSNQRHKGTKTQGTRASVRACAWIKHPCTLMVLPLTWKARNRKGQICWKQVSKIHEIFSFFNIVIRKYHYSFNISPLTTVSC